MAYLFLLAALATDCTFAAGDPSREPITIRNYLNDPAWKAVDAALAPWLALHGSCVRSRAAELLMQHPSVRAALIQPPLDRIEEEAVRDLMKQALSQCQRYFDQYKTQLDLWNAHV